MTDPQSPLGFNHALYSPVESSSFLESFDLFNMVTSPELLSLAFALLSMTVQAIPKGHFICSSSGPKVRLDAILPIPLCHMLGTLIKADRMAFMSFYSPRTIQKGDYSFFNCVRMISTFMLNCKT